MGSGGCGEVDWRGRPFVTAPFRSRLSEWGEGGEWDSFVAGGRRVALQVGEEVAALLFG